MSTKQCSQYPGSHSEINKTPCKQGGAFGSTKKTNDYQKWYRGRKKMLGEAWKFLLEKKFSLSRNWTSRSPAPRAPPLPISEDLALF